MINKTRNVMLILTLLIMLSGCVGLKKFPPIQQYSNDDPPTNLSNPTEISVEPSATSEPEVINIPFEPTIASHDPDNLVQDGYFLDDYESWVRDLVEEGGSSKLSIVNSENSRFDRELQMEQAGKGNLILSQTLPLPSPYVTFTATFEMSSSYGVMWALNGSGCGMIVLVYEDSYHETLGFTRILNASESVFAGTGMLGAPEQFSDTNRVHNMQVDSDKVYKDFSLEVYKEISENLLAIDPNKVAFITIALAVWAPDSGSGGALAISDIVIK